MADDLRLRVADRLAWILWPTTPWAALEDSERHRALRLAKDILPLLEVPVDTKWPGYNGDVLRCVKEDDWLRFKQAREKFLTAGEVASDALTEEAKP